MALEKTWRWFGPRDPITLREIKQTGATGIVTALHHIPVGEIWTVEVILKRKQMITSAGLTWSAVESVPVHEDIKKGRGQYLKYIDNYKISIRNLGKCGIDTVCYNFMPILDWSRTDLRVETNDGAITTKYETKVFAAFDIFILKRPDAEQDYRNAVVTAAKNHYDALSEAEKDKLIQTVLLGLPGSLQAYTIDEFRSALKEYDNIDANNLRENLYYFIREIIPVAEESKVFMVIHPDDPPWPLLGLPRIVSNKQDVQQILSVIDSPVNGLTLCTGSFGAGIKNDLVDLAQTFAHRINFIHLRNLTRNKDGDFMETYHLEGEIDLYRVMKTLLLEQERRRGEGRSDTRLPMRPDHGHLMIPEMNKRGIYPGYSLFGRMRGLAELRGMEIGIIRSLGIK
jgi:mannonate dehydratase